MSGIMFGILRRGSCRRWIDAPPLACQRPKFARCRVQKAWTISFCSISSKSARGPSGTGRAPPSPVRGIQRTRPDCTPGGWKIGGKDVQRPDASNAIPLIQPKAVSAGRSSVCGGISIRPRMGHPARKSMGFSADFLPQTFDVLPAWLSAGSMGEPGRRAGFLDMEKHPWISMGAFPLEGEVSYNRTIIRRSRRRRRGWRAARRPARRR